MNRNIGSAIVIVDKGFKIKLLSPSAQRILNLLPTTIGLPITALRMRINVEDIGTLVSKVIFTLHGITKEVIDEYGRYYDLQVKPYITLEDKIDGAVLSFTDVDDRKKLEKSLRLAAIGETAGMVGHDIRNPLQAITGDVFLLRDYLTKMPELPLKNDVAESLDEVEKNVEYINKIVADLQDFARTVQPSPQEIDLKALCNELIHGITIPKNIEASCYVDDSVSRIFVDSNLLKRALGNLVSNAVQAMTNGGKLIVRARLESNDIVITVTDTGAGIPDKIKQKLFTPFFTTKSKGQGLGLAVVKRMIEALNGTVTFESVEGNGTTFIVRLPHGAKR